MPQKTLKLSAFLPYQLSITSNAVSDLIARAYRGKFALKVPEWRVMALLGEAEVATQRELVAATAMGMERFPVTRLGKWATFALMAAVPWITLGSAGGAWSVFTYMGWAVGIPGVFVSYKSFFQYLPTVKSHLASGRRS